MEKEKNGPAKPKFNLSQYLRLCLKSWKLFLICIILIVGAGVLFVKTRVPVYQVDASVMLPNNEGSPTSMMAQLANQFSLTEMLNTSSTIDNELDIMSSYGVYLNTVKDLGLNNTCSEKVNFRKWVNTPMKPALKLEAPENISDTLKATLMFFVDRKDNGKFDLTMKVGKKTWLEIEDQTLPIKVNSSYGNFTITATKWLNKTPNNEFKLNLSSYAAAAEAYQNLVNIYIPNKKTDIIALSVETTSPEFGELLLQTIIDNYNKIGYDQKDLRNYQTLEYVEGRLDSLTKELTRSETEIEKFKEANNLTDVEVDAQVLLSKSGTIENALLMAQTENEILGMTRNFINNPDNNYSLIPSLAAPDMGAATASFSSASTAIAAYNELILQRMALQNSAKGNNAALTQINDQINAMRENIISTVNRAYENSKVKLSEINRENSTNLSRIGNLPTIERKYVEMKRSQLIQEQIYLYLIQQQEETRMNIERNRAHPNLLVLDSPHTLVETAGIKDKILLLAFLFLGFAVPAAFVLLFKYKKAPLASVNDFTTLSQVPVIGRTAARSTTDMVIADSDTADPVALELMRSLRQEVQHILSDIDGKVVLVTSTKAGEGTSYIASNLATALAFAGKNVCLIDANLRNPSIAEIFNISDKNSLIDCLTTGDIDQCHSTNVNLGMSRFIDIIPSGRVTYLGAELLSGDIMRHLIDHLREIYDYIVIDTPPVGSISDAFTLAPLSDLTVYVARNKMTTPQDVKFINTLYEDGRLTRMGLVLNGFKASDHQFVTVTTHSDDK